MGRRGHLYLPVDVHFLDDDRIVAAGDAAALLFLAMCLKAKALGTDGRLSEIQISRLARPKWKSELRRLLDVQAVLWDESTKDYFISAWFSHNEPISSIEARRAADRARKAGESPNGGHSNRNPSGRPP
jgi:hypothetical protein